MSKLCVIVLLLFLAADSSCFSNITRMQTKRCFPCQQNRNLCDPRARCVSYSSGGYSCKCYRGYVGNGKRKNYRASYSTPCNRYRGWLNGKQDGCRKLSWCVSPARYRSRHADFSPKLSRYEANSEITWNCDTGYVGPSTTIHCRQNGTWIGLVPICQKPCALPETLLPDNADYTPKQDTFTEGDLILWLCNDNYTGPIAITICRNGKWLGRIPTCNAICEVPDPPLNGSIAPSDKELFAVGDVVTYACHNNTELHGTEKSVCTDNHKFDPPAPYCLTDDGRKR